MPHDRDRRGVVWDNQHLSGVWELECTDHINALDLWAILNALHWWAPQLQGQVVSIQLDNHSPIAYSFLEGDTNSPRLMILD